MGADEGGSVESAVSAAVRSSLGKPPVAASQETLHGSAVTPFTLGWKVAELYTRDSSANQTQVDEDLDGSGLRSGDVSFLVGLQQLHVGIAKLAQMRLSRH